MKQAMKGFQNGIHREKALGFLIPKPIMSPKDAFTLLPRDQLPCANGLLPIAFIIYLHAIFKSFELYGFTNMETTALECPTTRGKLRKLQEEGHKSRPNTIHIMGFCYLNDPWVYHVYMENNGEQYAKSPNNGQKGKVFEKSSLKEGKISYLKEFKFLPWGVDLSQCYIESTIMLMSWTCPKNTGQDEKKKDIKHKDIEALQSPLSIGRLKRLKVEVQRKMDLLRGKEESKEGLMNFFIQSEMLNLGFRYLLIEITLVDRLTPPGSSTLHKCHDHN
ncbi:hypothetical protein CR513_49564, partial [Mucuna pruriens]